MEISLFHAIKLEDMSVLHCSKTLLSTFIFSVLMSVQSRPLCFLHYFHLSITIISCSHQKPESYKSSIPLFFSFISYILKIVFLYSRHLFSPISIISPKDYCISSYLPSATTFVHSTSFIKSLSIFFKQ